MLLCNLNPAFKTLRLGYPKGGVLLKKTQSIRFYSYDPFERLYFNLKIVFIFDFP